MREEKYYVSYFGERITKFGITSSVVSIKYRDLK